MEKEQIVCLLKELKKSVFAMLISVVLSSIICFIFYKDILQLLLRPVNIKVYYFSIQEVFFSSVELAIYGGIFFSFPFMVFFMWYVFKGTIILKPLESFILILFSIILFYAGSLFCYSIVLESGINFLLGFEGNALKAMISVGKFIDFSSAMIFAFGITFEMPVILLGLNKKGWVKSKTLVGTRRYAILLITIVSAVITPTPDVYNMMLLVVPAYILYETGIVLMKINERKN